jgi:predicted dehydrogenase
MANDKIRWGILGTGTIARKFATGLTFLPEAELAAIGSRSQATADRFGDEFNAPRRHASYEALANDPEVDVVYVATPHTFHKANGILCLNAGKPVLCEKPFTLNAREAAEMIALARSKRLFLMEAMWTRYIPLVVQLRQFLADGMIGEVRLLTADLGFRAEMDPKHRLFNPELGGGALLDVGVYTVSFASMIFGPPSRITGMAHLGQTGVDEQSAMIFGYDQGQLALLYAALRTGTPEEVMVMGTEGRIRVHPPLYCPSRLTVSRPGEMDKIIDVPFEGNGYNYHALEVMGCLRAGQLESEIMPLDETLEIMKTMDQVRGQWGLSYPTE